MAKLSYADQLRDPRWQKRRLETLDAAGWKCELCGNTERTLHVHHKMYHKGHMAWDYTDDYLQVLCDVCHDREHSIEEVLKAVMAFNSHKMSGGSIALGLVVGFMSGLGTIHEDYAEVGEEVGRGVFHIGVLASLFMTHIEAMKVLVAQIEEPNEVQKRALEWMSRGKPDGKNPNDQT